MLQFRAVIIESQWERKEEGIKSAEEAAGQMLESLDYQEATKADFFSCRLLLQSTVRKVEASRNHFSTAEGPAVDALLELLKGRVLQIEGMISCRNL